MTPNDGRNDRVSFRLAVAAALLIGASISCAGLQRADGLDPATVPADIRENYETFAQRCSRCHTLARPLNSNFTTMEEWRYYVRRMRRQPNSGISPQDEATIQVFLEYYTAERNRTRGTAR